MALAVACGPPQPQTLRGILVDVQSPSILRVESFTVRAEDGRELRFEAAPNFNQGVQHAMSPGHMREHMALADAVTVTFREEDGRLVALSAVD